MGWYVRAGVRLRKLASALAVLDQVYMADTLEAWILQSWLVGCKWNTGVLESRRHAGLHLVLSWDIMFECLHSYCIGGRRHACGDEMVQVLCLAIAQVGSDGHGPAVMTKVLRCAVACTLWRAQARGRARVTKCPFCWGDNIWDRHRQGTTRHEQSRHDTISHPTKLPVVYGFSV